MQQRWSSPIPSPSPFPNRSISFFLTVLPPASSVFFRVCWGWSNSTAPQRPGSCRCNRVSHSMCMFLSGVGMPVRSVLHLAPSHTLDKPQSCQGKRVPRPPASLPQNMVDGYLLTTYNSEPSWLPGVHVRGTYPAIWVLVYLLWGQKQLSPVISWTWRVWSCQI